MVTYHYEDAFSLREEQKYTEWINNVLDSYGQSTYHLDYIFCSDQQLLDINRKYLKHDFFTDIITFPREECETCADIFISIDRVKDNAEHYDEAFERELQRVMVHGILHLLGYKDNTEEARKEMRNQEDRCIEMFHVKQ